MRQVFERYRPEVVFHAAAYKHVPLMEANPVESVRNNVLATKLVADVAIEFGVERFVLISTDKALNPRAVYGQCKALCEWIVETSGSRPEVRHALRGRALRQRARLLGQRDPDLPPPDRARRAGDRDPSRDDALLHDHLRGGVPRACRRARIGGRGHVFVLDMGEPVKIVDLARNMIRLSGKEPDREVAIEFVGARPGEKLHEELWSEEERVAPTAHPKILWLSAPLVEADWLDERACRARAARRGGRHARRRLEAERDRARAAASRRSRTTAPVEAESPRRRAPRRGRRRGGHGTRSGTELVTEFTGSGSSGRRRR